MPITLTKGTLISRAENDATSTVTAVVDYEFSNGVSRPTAHENIAMADLLAIAQSHGREEYTRSDVAEYLTIALGQDLAPATIDVPPIAPKQG